MVLEASIPAVAGLVTGIAGTVLSVYIVHDVRLRLWKKALTPFIATAALYLAVNALRYLHLLQDWPVLAASLDLMLGGTFVYGLYRVRRTAQTLGT